MDYERLTYRELAERLRITVDSAKNLAKRQRWDKENSNDGLVRVLASAEYIADRLKGRISPEHAPPQPPPDPPAISPPEVAPEPEGDIREDIREDIRGLGDQLRAAYEGRIAEQAATIADLRARLDAAEARANVEQVEAERQRRARETAEQALTEERARPWWRRLVGRG